MQVYSGIGLREWLDRLKTAELDELLRMEMEEAEPDMDAVRLIMSILEQRDGEALSQISPEEQAAWERYQQRMNSAFKKSRQPRKWMAAAASLVVILGLLFAVVPQQAEAETFWQMLQRWSNTVLSYFGGTDQFRQRDYEFETDNEGLQQVYDNAVEMGITDPMIPMWLPNEPQLLELNIGTTPLSKNMWAYFEFNESGITFRLNVYSGENAHVFYRDGTYSEVYEKNGATFNITQNAGWWVVVWTKDNIECFLTLDCQEDTLRRILESIYVTED